MYKTFLSVITSLLAFTTANAAELFVDKYSADPQSPFQSWENAAIDIQDAISVAGDGDTIFIAPGVYTKPVGSTFVAVAYVTGSKLVHLVGTGATRDDVVIDGEGRNIGVFFYRNARVDDFSAAVRNMTIKNCFGERAGGVYLHASDSTNNYWRFDMRNCNVTSNTATSRGGGIGMFHAGPGFDINIENCEFSYNIVTNNNMGKSHYGGALSLYSNTNSTTVIRDCVFRDNWAPTGGAVFLGHGTHKVYNSEFLRNRAPIHADSQSGGGGIQLRSHAYGGSLDVRNCLFVDNSSSIGKILGGGIGVQYEKLGTKFELRNSTFWDNKNYAVYVRSKTEMPLFDMWNSIFYNNTSGDETGGPIGDVSYPKKAEFTNHFHNCSFASTNFNFYLVAENLIEGDPKFIDPEGGDFRLLGSSPAVGTGLYESWMDDAFDLDGKPRITSGMGVDMGAYAFRSAGSVLLLR